MRLVQALARHHRVTVVPFQKPGVAAAHGLSLAQCRTAAWAVTPERERLPGAAAINMALAVALGTRIPLWLYRLPGMRQLQDRVYAGIARYRGRLPGVTPYCEQYPDQCREPL